MNNYLLWSVWVAKWHFEVILEITRNFYHVEIINNSLCFPSKFDEEKNAAAESSDAKQKRPSFLDLGVCTTYGRGRHNTHKATKNTRSGMSSARMGGNSAVPLEEKLPNLILSRRSAKTSTAFWS